MLHLYAFTCQLLSLLYGVCLSYAVDVFSCCIRATAVVFGVQIRPFPKGFLRDRISYI